MRISFHLTSAENDSFDDVRSDTQQFIEGLQKWQEKEENRNHEIYVYINQR